MAGVSVYNYLPEKVHAGAAWGLVWSVRSRDRPLLTPGPTCGVSGHAGETHQTDKWLERMLRTGLVLVKKKGDLWQVGGLLATAEFPQTQRLKRTLKTKAKTWLSRWSHAMTLQGNK